MYPDAKMSSIQLDSMIQKIQQVTKMEAKDREHVFAMLDAFIKQNLSQTVLQ